MYNLKEDISGQGKAEKCFEKRWSPKKRTFQRNIFVTNHMTGKVKLLSEEVRSYS